MAHTHFALKQMRMNILQTKLPTSQGRPWHKALFWLLLICFTLGFNQPIEANTDPCMSLLTDNNMENIDLWQAKSNGDFPLFSSLLTHTGSYAAYLAGRNNAVDRVATALDLPAATTITLSFWWQLQSEEEQYFNDKLIALAVDDQGYPLQVLGEWNGRERSNQWQQYRADLSAWAGQTIQLQFLAQTDAELVTDFFVDDVAVVACAQP